MRQSTEHFDKQPQALMPEQGPSADDITDALDYLPDAASVMGVLRVLIVASIWMERRRKLSKPEVE